MSESIAGAEVHQASQVVENPVRIHVEDDSSSSKVNTSSSSRLRCSSLFELTIWLESSREISKLIEAFEAKDKTSSSASSSHQRCYWFCWTIFDRTFQSAEFSFSQTIPSRIKQSFNIECSSSGHLRNKLEQSTLRVFLCTNEKIIAKADVSILFENTRPGLETDYQVSGMTMSMPFQWFALHPLFKPMTSIQASIELGVDLKQLTTKNEASEAKPEVAESLPMELEEYPEPSPADHDLASKYQSRRFRLNIDVRSIAGLKRPAYIGISYNYPHLGYTSTAHAPVRTHPQWVVANSEAKFNSAKVSYDFCMNRVLLEEIVKSNLLKIHITSRSNLGSEMLGEVTVDLIPLIIAQATLFRCPISGKQFRSMKEYQAYRYHLVADAATNRIEKLPPRDPVLIQALDGLYAITPNQPSSSASDANAISTVQGAKLRVVLILEDLGVIAGPQDPAIAMSTAAMKPSMTSHSDHPADPLEHVDLSPQERSHLESLRLDWENWRKASEMAWMNSLKEKEAQLRASLQEEMNKALEERGASLKAAQEETSRLEIRLRQGSLSFFHD
jgi:hypothetical protein